MKADAARLLGPPHRRGYGAGRYRTRHFKVGCIVNAKAKSGGQRRRAATESDRGKILSAVAGAIGGALLGFTGNFALHAISQRDAAAKAETEKTEAVEEGRRTSALKLHEEYRRLGDLPLNAAFYIDTGERGSTSDVRQLFRHLHDLVAVVRLGKVDNTYVRGLYAGDLGSWGNRFGALGRGASPVSSDFARYELEDYCRLAKALNAIAGRSSSETCGTERTAPSPPRSADAPRRRSRSAPGSDSATALSEVNAMTATEGSSEVNMVLDEFLSTSNGSGIQNLE